MAESSSNHTSPEILTGQDAVLQQEEVLEALKRLSFKLKGLDDKQSVALSHYRRQPEAVQQAYDMLAQGAALCHASSTKYTLLGKLDAVQQAKLTVELLQGCQLAATATVVLHDDSTGCARSTRHYCKQAARAIVTTVLNLVQEFATGTAAEQECTVGAQKTGAVWQTCSHVTDKKLPLGNRNCMRRDLYNYMAECNDTMEEFQGMIDEGPTLREEDEDSGDGKDNNDNENGNDWEAFMSGQNQQYTMQELPIATACNLLVKCSRGSINATLQACEAAGKQLSEQEESSDASGSNGDDKALLSWISATVEMARAVGDGMTDLGAVLYPPMQLQLIQAHATRQAAALQALLSHIVDAAPAGMDGSLDLPGEVVELSSNLKEAVEKRAKEVDDAVNVLVLKDQ